MDNFNNNNHTMLSFVQSAYLSSFPPFPYDLFGEVKTCLADYIIGECLVCENKNGTGCE